MEQLYTRWGRAVDSDHVLQEYPRPLLQRKSYVNLNGYWEYAVTKKLCKPEVYDGSILVPFSPESALSGVGRQLQPDEYLWYRTKLPIEPDKLEAGLRLILHFGAVDQSCLIYVNGQKAARHTGGYLPFSVDITAFCRGNDVLLTGGAESGRETGAGAASESDRETGAGAGAESDRETGVRAGAESDRETGEGAVSASGRETGTGAVSESELVLVVRDLSDTSYHARGKQKLKRGGMFYTAQSGIWQTVWMEYVPENYVEELQTEPELERGTVRIRVHSAVQTAVRIQVREPALYLEKEEKEQTAGERGNFEQEEESVQPQRRFGSADRIIAEAGGLSGQEIEISLPVIKPWTCEEPYLYYFTVTMGDDTAESYFALRAFTIEKDPEGIPRICLNGQVQFQNGVLDQGYWPDGLYTAPSDEAFVFDILEMKKLGFNMLRKHIKIEPQRWYYHCDRLGMVVWQDMVNGGSYYKHWFVTYAATLFSRKRWKIRDNCLGLLSRAEQKGRREFIREMKETIRLLKGHPSIAVWVLFNEGWGQFHAEKMTEIARACDDSRLIDQASGWFDQKGGNLQSIHHYFFQLKFLPEKERATVLSEFGGYSLRIPGHSACEKLYGYGTHKDIKGLNAAFRERMRKMEEQIPKGLCAGVYTQLSDVEEEVNGIFTYDREVRKIEPDNRYG